VCRNRRPLPRHLPRQAQVARLSPVGARPRRPRTPLRPSRSHTLEAAAAGCAQGTVPRGVSSAPLQSDSSHRSERGHPVGRCCFRWRGVECCCGCCGCCGFDGTSREG
jgi:hypothetical protein